ncbi:Peptidase family M1 [Algoriphagus faecimaris]|uniref:Peptidase family M1 n=1 Tax=Algoriphagus faecimaris TaxID=686796 RepID=A0A1G6NAI1_9BACT|nr:M1 family aminopeptidase [Algoriphagus faecimaris]SDC64414.1 Peptidase family M1 [Algoriphagus faecimaris]
MNQFIQLIRFELLIQLKTWTAPVFALAYFGFAFLMGGQGTPASETVFNSEYQLFFKMGLLSLGAVFSMMFFVVKATQRDTQSQMEELVFVTPISKTSFFITRFFGAWLTSLMVILPALIGFHFGVAFSDLDPSRILEFQFGSSLSVAFKLLIPTVTTLAALLFTVGILTKNPLATYAMAVAIYAAYFICSIFLNSPLMANATPVASDNLIWAAVLDPFGLSAFFHQTNLWTSFEKNHLGVQLSGFFAWNRLIWFLISISLLTMAYQRFSFRKWKGKQKVKKEEITKALEPAQVEKLIPKTGQYRAVFASHLRSSLQFVFKSIPFWTILAAWLIIAATEIYFKLFSGGSYEESFYPATQILLDRVQQPLLIFGIFLLLFYSASLTWREKDSRMSDLIHATPAPKGLLFLASWTTLLILMLTMISLTVFIGLIFQLAQQPLSSHSWALFSLFLSPGLNLVYFSTLFLLIQRFIPHKYLGIGLSAISFGLFAGPLSSTVGLSHPLFQFGNIPFLTYSELAGFAIQVRPFLHLSLIWGVFTLALGAWLYSVWDQTISLRGLKILRNTSTRLALLFSTLFLGFWTGMYLKTEREESFPSMTKLLDQRAWYEKEFKKYIDAPVLAYADLHFEIDMKPSQGAYEAIVRGKLVNPSTQAVQELLIQEKESLHDLILEKTEDYGYVEELKLYHIRFKEPIFPGDSLGFSFTVKPQKNILGSQKALVPNGSYLNFRDFAPFFGYSESMEIKDYAERKKRNLPPKPLANRIDTHSGSTEKNLFKVTFEAIVKTEKDQTALTSGKLIERRVKENRSIYHFKSTEPILPSLAFFSGHYQKDSLDNGSSQLEVYSLETHSRFNSKTLQIMKEALIYCTENFGEYPFNHLKLVEIPGFWGIGGYAHPGVISMTEDKYFLVKEGSPQFDLQTKRAVHEVAHQWFGHLLAPRNVPGATLFVEGLAKYAEVLLLEKMIGKSTTWYLSDQANRTYFTGRAISTKPENSLSEQENQSYLAYGKSLSAFLAARDLLGEKELNSIIRELVDTSRSQAKPVVDSQLLLEKMMEKTSPEGQELLVDWFQKIITYDIRIINTNIEKAENGFTQVTIDYEANKMERQADGSELEIYMDEEMELATFLTHPKNIQNEQEIILSQKVRIKSGKGQLKVRLDKIPKIIALDPWGTRPDQNREDNFMEIKARKAIR